MKKTLLFTSLFLITCVLSAQDLISKIPSDVSAVLAIKGKNITDLVTTNEFENSKLGKLFFEKLIKNTEGKVTNFESLGVDVTQNFYYYFQNEEGNFTHTFLVPLKNKENMVAMLPENTQKRVVEDQNVSYFTDLYDTTVTMWDNNTLIMVIYQEGYKYEDYSYNDSYYEATEAATEAAAEAVEAEDTYGYNDSGEEVVIASSISAGEYPVITFDEYDYYFGDVTEGEQISHTFNFTNTGDAPLIISNVEATCGCTVASFPTKEIEPGKKGTIAIKFDTKGLYSNQSRTIKITSNTEYEIENLYISGYVLDKVVEVTAEDENAQGMGTVITEENEAEKAIEIIEIPVPECDSYGYTYNYNNDYYTKEQEELNAKNEEKRQENLVLLIEKIKTILASNDINNSILSNNDYKKAIGNGTDEAVFWVNDFGTIYDEVLTNMAGSSLYNPYDRFNFKGLYGGMSLTSKLNFETTKATINTSYSMNDKMAAYSSAMYDGTLNKNFFKYINEDELQGYLSVNMSTEGILKAYPQMIDAMFEGVKKEHLGDIIPIGTRLLSILLDEEAIAKAFRGDMLFVMTGLEQKEVSYTTYEYDENYESTEVTKTKTETLPNFLFMVTSEEQEIFNRLMRIGIKEKAITFENGIYQLNVPDMPFTLNMFFKGNTLLIGNSTKNMTAIHDGSFKAKVSSKHKKLMSKNATTFYVNAKLIANQIPEGTIPEPFTQKLNYFKNNVEDVIFRVGKMNGNTMEGEMILNTPLNNQHKNSLAYFMNMVDSLVD